MPGGRPTVATDENVAKAWEYVNDGWKEVGEAIPTVEGLAVWLDIHKDTIYEREEFSDVAGRLKNIQGSLLITGGLKNTLNSTIAKLLLSSKHGYVEKSETDVTSKGESITPPNPELAAKFAEFVKQETSDGES